MARSWLQRFTGQDVALRNAHQATQVLLRQRREREDVEAFLASWSGSQTSRSKVSG